MIEIRNLQFQPLTFNLSGQGTLSTEIKTAGKRGLVRITDLTGGVEPEPEKPTATDDAAADEAKTTSKRRK